MQTDLPVDTVQNSVYIQGKSPHSKYHFKMTLELLSASIVLCSNPVTMHTVMFCIFLRSAKRLLDQIVEKGRPTPGFHHGDGPGNAVQEIMIPASKAGLVIGKGGETIKQLQVSCVVLGADE